MDTESYDSWLGFLRRIKGRGVQDVQLVTSDAHKGLVGAIEEVFHKSKSTHSSKVIESRLRRVCQ